MLEITQISGEEEIQREYENTRERKEGWLKQSLRTTGSCLTVYPVSSDSSNNLNLWLSVVVQLEVF